MPYSSTIILINTSTPELILEQLQKRDHYISENPEYLKIKALSLAMEGRNAESEKILKKAILLSADKTLYYRLAQVLEAQGKIEESERTLEFISAALPGLITPHFLLAKLYLKSGRISAFNKEADLVLNFKGKVENSDVDDMIKAVSRMKKTISQRVSKAECSP